MRFISGLHRNHLLEKEENRILSAQIIQSQLTEKSTNGMAQYIYLNQNMTFRIKVLEDWSFDKRFS